ncbi:thiol:disulfide interchange protein DsbA/DsbL [Pseudidiomarina andamanensis]|uniref:Thiol:disulfide interchange protein n=1 Tax=Pseudidiomarina andamanensis TaxID=1940690 RepID=A0AA92EUU9_9GAMM|nr:thiol:disulfide interchange protein DsbA/DsbL [Pseudidiomarina andamanensis]MDS0218818.1 thiol:disulfide interchange protein DsbA/DsbL [Pseudidiomarina andamanensis]QGT96186.1 thiol:disulfide interchange protein DsbA/DsbL [Pseudidiomarina andamanensis]
MKKLLLVVVAFMMLPLSAQEFKEDVHYEVIAEQGTAKPEIKEFFSFYCIHCYRFEPIAAAMKEAYPQAFEKSHIVSHPTLELMARGFAAAKLFKKEEAISQAFYERIHAQKQQITTEEQLQAIFHVNGISKDKFEKAMKHPLVEKQVNDMDRDMRAYNVNATPTFIVNGKYRLKTEGFRDSKDFMTDFVKAAGYLLEKQ